MPTYEEISISKSVFRQTPQPAIGFCRRTLYQHSLPITD
jgi:hypothetical protein